MIDISVIIVNWNTKILLLDCVESLYRTTLDSSMEIIVVDNASSDGSVDSLQKRFSQVKVIENPDNFGFAKANNIGINKASGRYICLVNSDVIALGGVLDKMRIYMENRPAIGALAPKTYFGDMQIQKNCREYPTLRNIFCQEFLLNTLFPTIACFRGRDMTWFDHNSVMEIEVLSGCFLMVRREVIDQVGLLDEQFFFYSEDVDWCKRIHDAGWKLVHYPMAEAMHLGHGSSSNDSSRYDVAMVRANWQYWRKHKNSAECILFWLIKFTGTLARAIGWFAVLLFNPGNRRHTKVKADGYRKMLKWLVSLRPREPFSTTN